jgi:hypothetical protein
LSGNEEDRRRAAILGKSTHDPFSRKHLTAIDIITRNGGFDDANDVVEPLTGTPPRSFHDFLVVHRDALLAATKPQK